MQRLFLMCSLALCAFTANAASYKLNLFIWSEYIDPAIIDEFERRFDCKVTMDFYEDEATMLAKLRDVGSAQYDVVVPPDHTVPELIRLKLLSPLRVDNIPNIRNIDERFSNPWYDPSNRYTVPYWWGTIGIYARKPADKPYDESWSLLFDAKEQTGPFVLVDRERDAIGAALRYKGHSVNTIDHAELNEALNVLIDARKRSLGFASGVGGKNKVLAKEATAAMAYSGDAMRAMKEDGETYFFIPREGAPIWVDNLAVCAKAPHRIVAEKFINFILKPEVGAQLADYSQYATPNKAAMEFVQPANLDNPMIYPPPQIMKRLEFLRSLGKKSHLYDEVWGEVKNP